MYKELCAILQCNITVITITRTHEETVCCCNGNPMLKELSVNLLLTIGFVRPLKIEDIHSEPLGLVLGLHNHPGLSLGQSALANQA